MYYGIYSKSSGMWVDQSMLVMKYVHDCHHKVTNMQPNIEFLTFHIVEVS